MRLRGRGFGCNACKAVFRPGEGLITLDEALVLGSALSHPVRREIMLQFTGGRELSAKEVALALKEGLGQISYHIKVLRDAKPPLLLKTKQRHVRGAIEKFYRANQSIG